MLWASHINAQHSTQTHTELFLIHSININHLSAHREIRYILNVQLETASPEKYSTGEHISLKPVSKVDGILAKIFIYNILQQRLDRLLLAVLRRKRGRSVHEWDCRLG